MSLPYSIDFLLNLEDGAFVVNRERQILLWNSMAEKLTGLESQVLIGKSCARHLRCHIDDSGNSLCEEACPLKKALISGKPQELESNMRHISGSLIPVKIKVIPYHNQQGFIEGAIEIFQPISQPEWLYSSEVISDRITFTDAETGLYNRNFLDSYYLRLVKEQRAHYDRGLVFVDVEVLGEIRNIKSKLDAFTMRQKVAEVLMLTQADDGEMVAARWTNNTFVVLINNSHPLHLQDVVLNLENALRLVLYNEHFPSFDVTFRLMSTLISSDEPLEKVVDILQKRAKGFKPKRKRPSPS